MTNRNEASSGDERPGESLLAVECRGCGTPVRYAGTGRPPRYCSPGCRQRAWALRKAEETLSADADPRPQVVRETVERRVETTPRPPSWSAPSAAASRPPSTAREWERLLHALAEQLADEGHQIAREHWHHRRLYNALVRAMTGLGHAHPGGLDQLGKR